MTCSDIRRILAEAPLIASVQASDGSPVDDPETLLKLALASLSQGVRILRIEGVANIRRIREATSAPIIGLIKNRCSESDVYITPTSNEVAALLETGCEVIGIDATRRPRPGGCELDELIAQVQAVGRLVLADCDGEDSAQYAVDAGADLLSTTLAGYTESPARREGGPDLESLATLCRTFPSYPVLAEGRFEEPWQARAAMRLGASGVVIGGALNDPVKQTARFARAVRTPTEPVGAVDIGGTWLRAGIVTPNGEAHDIERIPVPRTRIERNAWINAWIEKKGVRQVGIGAGGIIRPDTGEVIFSKPIIPDHVGTIFSKEIEAEQVVALNDGHATAWAHGLHPSFAGKRVATLALGTGVGFGLVDRGRILMGRDGEHPRINDTPTRKGRIFDDLLGGAAVTANPSASQIADAMEAGEEAVRLINTLYYPDAIVLAGGIALQPWMDLDRFRRAAPTAEVHLTPFGADAGLIGAGFLALFPM